MNPFPAQEIPNQQAPIQQPIVTPTLNPVQEPPQQQKRFRKFFNLSSWIVLFALLPVTVLIFLSQNTVPGDLFYPVKRSLENVILAAASVSPATRTAFRTDLTEARFKEAQGLIASKSNTSGLTTLILEVQSINLEVASLKNDTEKKKERPIWELGEHIESEETKVRIPFVDDFGEHEGRHRAYAAMLKGKREIPVAVPLERSERRSLGEEFVERVFPDSDPYYRREWIERFEGGFPESSMDKESRQIYQELLKEREIEEP
jgi:hypothetical protein